MTMERTRHKLEPQCVQSCKQGTVQQTRTTLTTKKKVQNKQAQGTHESSVNVLVSVHMLQVCGQYPRAWYAREAADSSQHSPRFSSHPESVELSSRSILDLDPSSVLVWSAVCVLVTWYT